MSKAQIKRDQIAILRVLPEDGTPITMAEILLRAGEDLYPAMRDLVERGKVVSLRIDDRQAYARAS